MIPSHIRLYTWVDVEEVFLYLQTLENGWEQSVIWIRAYWDNLTLGIRPHSQPQVKQWLQENFEPRFQDNSEAKYDAIILEGLNGSDRTLPIIFEETDESPYVPKLISSLTRPSVIWQPNQLPEFPTPLEPNLPPVVTFHSFKGGVGRTTHILALAQALSTSSEKYQVLLIDADLEAPGISWIFEKRFPNPLIAFADLLALVHGDTSPDGAIAIQLVADRLIDSMVDGIYVLPAYRSSQDFTSLEIRPEHLIQGSSNPFILTEILSKLGKKLGVDAVLVDLRAGLSELATGLLLDPRVYRTFVTTLSAQSLAGTEKILKLIGAKSPATDDRDPLPSIIISQVPSRYKGDQLEFESSEKLGSLGSVVKKYLKLQIFWLMRAEMLAVQAI